MGSYRGTIGTINGLYRNYRGYIGVIEDNGKKTLKASKLGCPGPFGFVVVLPSNITAILG